MRNPEATMGSPSTSAAAVPVEHGLLAHLPKLARFESTKELKASPLFKRLQPEIDRVLGTVHVGSLAPAVGQDDGSIRALAWNIERGIHTPAIIEAIQAHA